MSENLNLNNCPSIFQQLTEQDFQNWPFSLIIKISQQATQETLKTLKMNHSDQSTSEDNFEQGTDSRHSSSYASKKKSIKKVESTSTDEILEHDLESDFPQSIERTRYNQTNDEGLRDIILDPHRINKKDSHYKDSQRIKKMTTKTKEKASQRITEDFKPRKNNQFSNSEPSSYQNSFDDKFSFQTMDPKQFSSYYEYPQKQLVENGSILSEEQVNSFSKRDKNNFDSHIIEHENQQDEQNNVHIFEQHSQTKIIELENPHNNQDKFKLMNFTAQTEKSTISHEIDPVQAKFLIRQKKNQISQLNEAYVQTLNQNEVLKTRVKQLEECLKKVVKEKQEQENFFKNLQLEVDQEQFKETVKIFRKYSL